MTEKEYEKKIKEIVNWADEETERITKNIDSIGLDTNKDKYKRIHNEYSKRIKKLKEEYNK